MHLPCPFPWLLLAAGLAAQGTPADEADAALMALVAPRLASENAADVAWGAHLVARHEIPRTRPALRKALRRWRDIEGAAPRQVRLHLVDALWAIRARVPGEEIAPLLDDALTRVPAFLLLTIDVRWHRDRLAQLAMHSRGWNDAVPYAAGSLLVDAAVKRRDIRVPAFAEHLLGVAACKLSVTVIDEREAESNGWNSAAGSGTTQSDLTPEPGLPPLVQHRLTMSNGVGSVIRAGRGTDWDLWNWVEGVWTRLPLPPGGRDADPAVFHHREIVPSIPADTLAFEGPQPYPNAGQAIAWLERIAVCPLPSFVAYEVHWRDEDTLREAIDAKCAELRALAVPLRTRLVEQGWLPDDAAGDFRLPIEISVWDHRGDTSTKLPKFDGK